MKYKIRGQEKEKVVFFWLEAVEGEITLNAREAGGREWRIISITEEGLFRYIDIIDDLGFPVDERRRIELSEGKGR